MWRSEKEWRTGADIPLMESGHKIARLCMYVLSEGDTVYFYFASIIKRLHELGIAVDPLSLYIAPINVEYGPRLSKLMAEAGQAAFAHWSP